MRKLVAVLSLLAAALVFSVVARADDEGFITHQEALEGQIQEALGGDTTGVGPGQQGKSQAFCGTNGEAGRGAFDKDVSCDDPFAPDNENSVAADPANPNLVMVGTNDYQLNFVGSTLNEQIPSGFYLSEDGGKTWIDGNLPMKGDLGGGDPVAGWNDKYNEGVFASLSFVCGQLAPVCSRGNVMFASFRKSQLSGDASKDTINWSDTVIANGNSSDVAAQQIFNDKEWLAIDNNPASPGYGNMYVTFSKFRFEKLAYDESPIWFTMSSDGGTKWTAPVEISGRNPSYCTFQADPN